MKTTTKTTTTNNAITTCQCTLGNPGARECGRAAEYVDPKNAMRICNQCRLLYFKRRKLTPIDEYLPAIPKRRNASRFQKGSGCYRCRICKKLTRSVGHGDSEHIGLCARCYEMAGAENSVSDGQMTHEEFLNEFGAEDFVRIYGQAKLDEVQGKTEQPQAAPAISCEFCEREFATQDDLDYHVSGAHRHEIIAREIAKFPKTFGLRAFPGDTFRIGVAQSYLNDQNAVTLYTQRLSSDGGWLDFCKGTASELRAQIVEIAQPQTAAEIVLTPLEKRVLKALFESSDDNGHDFGFVEDCRSAVDSPDQLSGVISSLVKKGIIWVDDEKINNLTQTTWRIEPSDVLALLAEPQEIQTRPDHDTRDREGREAKPLIAKLTPAETPQYLAAALANLAQMELFEIQAVFNAASLYLSADDANWPCAPVETASNMLKLLAKSFSMKAGVR